MLVAARMHCCVAGVSASTPTLFLTYSNKGKGMSRYVYGHSRYDLDCGQMLKTPETFVSLFEEMLAQRDNIRSYLDSRSAQFNQDSMLAGEQLRDSMK